MRRTLRALAVTSATLLLGLGGAGTAAAHNTLVDSTPADGARLQSSPNEVRLVFDQPVREGYNTVTVVGPDGGHWTDGPVQVRDNAVSVPVRSLGSPGAYSIGYRVLSDDGHPVTGELTFHLSQAGNGSPTQPGHGSAQPGNGSPDPHSGSPAATPDHAHGAHAAEDSGGMPVWPWITGAATLVVLGLALALRLGRTGKGD